MSGMNGKNARSGDRLTVAGFAAVIVVGVFVVCVILILAKSLFPSNEPELTKEVDTATVTETTAPPATTPAETTTAPAIVTESKADSSQADSAADSSSQEEHTGEMMTVSQAAYLRSSGDMNAEPLLSIGAGEQVEVIERPANSEYVHVKYYTYDGWIYYEYLY
ncbi:MAG: SH3 domain-containing protein [Ruminococcus sp.]|nr:SH3 domain-containing protein [Ruminococcus sp.]